MAQSILEESKQAKRGIFRVFFKRRNIIIIVSVLIIAGGAWYYFSGRSSKSQAATVQVKQSIVKQEDLKISIESSGKVVAKDGVELSFPVSGNLEVSNVYVKEGDKIKKGDKIAAVKTETLEFELKSAYNSYQSALASYNDKVAGATESEISKSEASIEQAQVSLDQAKISLEKTKDSAAQSITDAETALKDATEDWEKNKDVYNSEVVSDAYADLLSATKSASISFQKLLHDSDSIIGVDETIVNDDFETALGAKNSASLAAAKDSYNQAKAMKTKLDSYIQNLTAADMGSIDNAADQAEAALEKLQTHFYDMQSMLDATITFTGLTQTKLDGFKSTVSSDRSSVNSSISSLDSSVRAASDAKNDIDQYQTAYDKAVTNLATAKSDATQDVNNATISVRSREISLEQAKIDYADLIAPLSASDRASATSQLTSASIAVDRAKYNMEQATLTSPIDGIVSMLNYKTGDIILSDSAKSMATVINNDTLYIEVNIEEADISKLKVGQKAEATLDAVEGLTLEGEVSFISLTSSTSSNGIVTYLVRVALSNTGETQIREGMTASIEFIISEAKGVLTVPVDAVRNISGQPSVQKADGTYAVVTTGFTDGKKVEVISGLAAGDRVIY